MARKNNPEQTYENILNTAAKLFVEKGYEQTSIQNILDALKLSKGGLYHHFKSKEEILEAVMQKRAQNIYDMLKGMVQNTQAKNAKEKLKKILYNLCADAQSSTMDGVFSSQVASPYFMVNGLQICVTQDAKILCELIEAGVQDGSLQTQQPKLCAEVFLLLLNYWANPVLFGRDYAETKERFQYLQSLMCMLGIDIVDDELIALILKRYQKMGAYTTE